MGPSIYFAYDLVLNGIKVGVTKNKVSTRITDDLDLIGAVTVDTAERDPRRLETAIHYCLRDHAIHGERFYPDKPVVDFVTTALAEGIESALARYGDDAFVAIGFRHHFHKKMTHDQLRRSIREGHPTRLYASDAWGVSQLHLDIGGTRVKKREFLRLCPLREFRVFNSRLLSMKPDNSVAILVEDHDGSELIEVAAP